MIASIVVGIITGVSAAWLSLWQARSLKLWEKREQSYLEVLNSLQAMYRVNGEFLDAYLEDRDISPSKESALRDVWREEQEKMFRHSELGEFLTSAQTEEVLRNLRKDLSKPHASYFEHLDSSGAALRHALQTVKQVALADRRQVPLTWFRTNNFP